MVAETPDDFAKAGRQVKFRTPELHASHDYDIIRETFGKRIKALQYRYERDGHKLGGIHVLGGNCRLNPLLIFGDKA